MTDKSAGTTAVGSAAPGLAADQDDVLSRTRRVMPETVSRPRRVWAAARAFIGGAPPGAEPGSPHVRAPDPAGASSEEERGGAAGHRPADLAVDSRPSARERARSTWRSTDYLERLDRAIAQPRLRRCVTVAVVSPKGGVGKTTTTSLLGMLLAQVRRDRIVAVDTNPDYGSLGRVLTPDQQLFVDDLLDQLSHQRLTLTELDAQLGRAAHGLMVLPAPTDPARMARLDEKAYATVIAGLKEYVGVILLDCGTGLQEPAARAALEACDQIVLVTDAEPATASLVVDAGDLLVATGRPMTVVINKMPRQPRLDVRQLARFLPSAVAMTVLPTAPAAADTLSAGDFDWAHSPDSWARSVRELAVALVADWPRLDLTAS